MGQIHSYPREDADVAFCQIISKTCYNWYRPSRDTRIVVRLIYVKSPIVVSSGDPDFHGRVLVQIFLIFSPLRLRVAQLCYRKPRKDGGL